MAGRRYYQAAPTGCRFGPGLHSLGQLLGGKISHVDDYQIELGNKCIDWGYDLVIGNHAHVLSGINKNKENI